MPANLCISVSRKLVLLSALGLVCALHAEQGSVGLKGKARE
jgi:hypothetical protein